MPGDGVLERVVLIPVAIRLDCVRNFEGSRCRLDGDHGDTNTTSSRPRLAINDTPNEHQSKSERFAASHTTSRQAMSRPILAVDVDGVISLFGHDEQGDRPTVRLELVDGVMHCISLAAGDQLRRLSEHFELVWATGWEKRANKHLPELLGIPKLPHISFGAAARFGSAHWKLGPLDAYGPGRAIAWIDDSFDERCHAWARERSAPTMLVPVDPRRGLEEAQTEALAAWAGALEREARNDS